ncbi:MAG: HAD family phosphatase [Actinomycetia bacterium]|nr:HAD family phosphatase [Actinomycetes bacterium]
MGQGLVFDFDGLILDTESPLYEAWVVTYEHFGVEPISLPEWSLSLGRHDDDPLMLDPYARLEEALGRRVDRAEVHGVRRGLGDQALDIAPLQPGVEALLDEAEALGLAVAIASSSPPEWIQRHLEPRGLLDRFPVLSCAGEGLPGKPHPAVYIEACRAIGADPTRSLALEDSPNGAHAAKAAGMACVIVPTVVSRHLDLDHADLVVTSLEHLVLADWF